MTARFDDAARQYAAAGQSGPYVVLTVAGQTDGRPAAAVRKKHTTAFLLASEVGGNIARRARPARRARLLAETAVEMLRRTAAAVLALRWPVGPRRRRRARTTSADKERWMLDAVSAEQAWHITRGKGVTVAVLDTGVDGSHPDLSGSVTTGPDFIKSVAPHAGRVHGTWMASLIAGHGHGSNDGIIGIAPEAEVLSVRTIADPDEPGYDDVPASSPRTEDSLPKAIRYAADHGVDVINMSLGGPSASTDERAAVAYAISKGIVVVASAGNDGDSKSPKKVDKDGIVRLSYPAAFPGVIGVAARGTRRQAGEVLRPQRQRGRRGPGRRASSAPGRATATGTARAPARPARSSRASPR